MSFVLCECCYINRVKKIAIKAKFLQKARTHNQQV